MHSQSSTKRHRIERTISLLQRNWKSFWDDAWKKQGGLKIRKSEALEDAGGLGGESFETMEVHPAFGQKTTILVRKEWKKMWEFALERQTQTGAFIIIGHPGIGKTFSLWYLLTLRVSLGLPTFFQTRSDFVWYFHEGGVDVIFPNELLWHDDETHYERGRIWALVDSNNDVKCPAQAFLWGSPQAFVVQVASCSGSCTKWANDIGGYSRYHVEPLSPSEMLQVNSLQDKPEKYEKVHDFYHVYGPSSRECYNTRLEENFSQFVSEVNGYMLHLTWDDLPRLIGGRNTTPTHSDSLILIEPSEDHPRFATANVISREIMRKFCNRRRPTPLQILDMFETCTRSPGSALTARWMFECRVFDMLELGIDQSLFMLTPTLKNDSEGTHDSYALVKGKKKKPPAICHWKYQEKEHFAYNERNTSLVLDPNRHYVPIESRFAKCDPFTFERVSPGSYQGPILDVHGNVLDKTSCKSSEIGLFTVFEATSKRFERYPTSLKLKSNHSRGNAIEHIIKESSLSYILRVAEHNKLEAVAIRHVTIYPLDGEDVIVKLPVLWRGTVSVCLLCLPKGEWHTSRLYPRIVTRS